VPERGGKTEWRKVFIAVLRHIEEGRWGGSTVARTKEQGKSSERREHMEATYSEREEKVRKRAAKQSKLDGEKSRD